MKSHYSISIPKPCHEDWSKMTPNEKGRFCKSCTKTVVDFTKMSPDAIQDYLHNNKDQRICGHIKQSQLDSINLRIPEAVIHQNQSFHRLFLLALLISMGMTLFSCEDENGQKKKIESIEVVETKTKVIDTLLNNNEKKEIQQDSLIKKDKSSKTEIKVPQIEGMMITETLGDIVVQPSDTTDIALNDIEVIDPNEINTLEGEISTQCNNSKKDNDIIVGLFIIEQPPEFLDTPKQLTAEEKKTYFSDRIQEIVKENFNQNIGDSTGLKGKQRIFTQFTINETGEVENIKVRAPHPLFEAEAKRVINLLPKFKPGNQRGKAISMVHNLPITFVIED
ncbi:energy transducer TonB [Winogradskyella marincola]|uniref:Energy transducer TonB n=1 Tax=Winogradskyella marincola TaxID=3037795 RepID=A0ABT6G1X7_9FLAO|nr:energy transducer TonB [Winogradskyella sp. YYF002]MDG4716047.1 energy transducer TonB [Winogradskyella sp. YYF002]